MTNDIYQRIFLCRPVRIIFVLSHLSHKLWRRIEMPPLEHRRGLAGSIISTAVTVALIGSATGLTVSNL